MVILDLEKRWEVAMEVIGRRDAVIRRIAYNRNLTIVAERKPIAEAGWEASYKLQAADGRVFPITDRAILSDQELEDNVLKQIADALAGA
jgi:hypothetical protein